MKCCWTTDIRLEWMDTDNPQNLTEWRGHLRSRLVKQVQPSKQDNGYDDYGASRVFLTFLFHLSHSVASYLEIYCLPMSHKKGARLIWIN